MSVEKMDANANGNEPRPEPGFRFAQFVVEIPETATVAAICVVHVRADGEDEKGLKVKLGAMCQVQPEFRQHGKDLMEVMDSAVQKSRARFGGIVLPESANGPDAS